jgi:hypothetical protein
MAQVSIPGYRRGDPALPAANISAHDFDRLLQSVLFTSEDRDALREAKTIVEPRVEEILDVWYGFVGGHDFLLASFETPDGAHGEYLARVRARFGQWVRDTLSAEFDDEWLRYQAEIGRRHAAGKNATDEVSGAPAVVPLRYVIALIYPITATMRPFLAAGARDDAHLDRMHQAWLKAVILSVTLWSEPYTQADWF